MVFGWFKPKSPIGVRMKAWVETRMVWLAAQFGIERLRRAKVILPTAEFFSEDYRGTSADAERCSCGFANPWGASGIGAAGESAPMWKCRSGAGQLRNRHHPRRRIEAP